ncbi:HIT family protein [Micromonospora sp. ZYX-F-536]|uniref:HIT family protein n=1 Tax=Micromonospora sp. ZYX-F-536 TaxID=3457629 RepID=UPI004040C28A
MASGSIDVPVADPCAFCDYLFGKRPFTVLHRASLYAILVTREQRGLSHLLVVPTSHRPTLLDLQADEPSALMEGLLVAARIIDKAERSPGIAVWQNNGVPAHQTIPHVHFHVAGTLPDGGTDWETVPELSVEETDKIALRLRPFLPLAN